MFRLQLRLIFFILILLSIKSFTAFALTTTYISNKDRTIYPVHAHYGVFEDESGSATFEEVLSDTALFEIPGHNAPIIPRSKHTSSSYWIKVKLKIVENLHQTFVIEFLDQKIDTLDVYLPYVDTSGTIRYSQLHAGDQLAFSNRTFQHKNFTFLLPKYPTGTYYIFAKIQASERVDLTFFIKRLDAFIAYALTEYFFLALFYGLLLTTALISFFIFMSLKEWLYLFYALYALFLGVYFVFRDGLGFHFIWSGLPEINNWVRPISYILFMSMYVLYTIFFLQIFKDKSIVSKHQAVILLVVLVGVLCFEAFLNIYEESLGFVSIPLIIASYFAVLRIKEGSRLALYLFSGNLLLLAGVFFDVLNSFEIIANDWVGYYGVVIGFASEFFMLSIAIASRLKTVIDEKNQLQQNITIELEKKVEMRTQELKQMNEELDMFVYRASHDIKGPLKSIIGISKLGIVESNAPKDKEYYEYILKSADKLDKLITNLLKLSHIKDTPIEKTPIALQDTVKEVVKQLLYSPDCKNFKIYISGDPQVRAESDQTLLHLTFQNLIENAIKYRDNQKDVSWLRIVIDTYQGRPSICFEDNGIGIPDSQIHHIFNMYYRVKDTQSKVSGSGLGLFIVKRSLDRLGVQIQVQSQQKKGTLIRLLF